MMAQKLLKGWGCFGVIAVVLIIGAAAQIYYGGGIEPETLTPEQEAERAAYQRDLATLETGRAAIRDMLKDPESARFGEAIGRVKHGQRVACGFVNGRNSFGGYAGEQRWVVLPDKNLALIRGVDGARFDQTWNRYCTGEADQFAGARLVR